MTSTVQSRKRTLLISFGIITGFMLIEAIGGWVTGSLALLSDAGHMLSDAIALGATLMAFIIGERAANQHKTFGYKRFEILVAGFNGATLIIIAVMITIEAIKRLQQPPEIATLGMLVIAATGLIINLIVAWLLHRDMAESHAHHGHNHTHGGSANSSKGSASDHTLGQSQPDTSTTSNKTTNLNMHSAFLHVLGDLLGSVAAIVAALLIMAFGWQWADPVVSVLVAVLIAFSGVRVLKQSLHILMEGAPDTVSVTDIERTLTAHPQVVAVHDVHLWSITSGLHAMSAHVVVAADMSVSDSSVLIAQLQTILRDMHIHHSTLQIEAESLCQSDTLICDLTRLSTTDEHHIGHGHGH